MAYVAADMYVPPILLDQGVFTSYATAGLIDATGEKACFWGPIAKSGNIRNVGFRFNTVTKAGGSGLTASLQDMDLTITSGTPRPDGTADQSVAIANGDANFASNTFYLSGNLDTDRTVTRGDIFGLVIEFDGSGRLGSDSVNFSYNNNRWGALTSGISNFASSSWSDVQGAAYCIFKYDDGSYGTFSGVSFASTQAGTIFNSGSTPDEVALEFSVPFDGQIDGGWALVYPVTLSADFSAILYEGTTALATVSIDASIASQNGTKPTYFVFSSKVNVSKNTVYRIAVRPDTANNIQYFKTTVPDSAYWDAMPGEVGTEMGLTSRTNAGSWAAVTATERPMIGVHYCAIDVGGAGGGLLAHPGMRGGFA